MEIFKQPQYLQALPWYIYDYSNNQLITSVFVPGDISDTKEIILAETPIPGLNYQPIQSGGMGNRKISFELPLIKRNSINGNVALLKQFEMLRNPVFSFSNISAQYTQFVSNPKVIYQWGIGSTPLIWYVKKCDGTHKKQWVNAFGQPMYSEIQIELWLDEGNQINKMEDVYREMMAITGQLEGSTDSIAQTRFNKKPY